MSWRWCNGRECKLGWGYNDPLYRLIPVQGDPSNVTSQAVSQWWYYVYPLSSTDIVYWPWISLLLEPSCKKYLDFQIVFDDNQYWDIWCRFSRRREGSEKFSKYPSNCSHFVRYIDYGVDLRVYFPTTGFPKKDDEVETLFEERNFTKTQRNTKCRALINYNEIREMTLGELLEFMKELEEGKHSQYDIPVRFEYEKLTQEFRETVVSNQKEFGDFLSYLYCVYRKIEMKMEKAGYPDILPDLDSQQKSFTNICSNLNKAKEEYKLVKSNASAYSLMNVLKSERNDFLKIYLVLKKLFFCYTDYIRYTIDHEDKIGEGDHLPGTCSEMIPWLRKLNTWVPDITKVEWINCIRCTALINSNEIREMTLGQLLELRKDIQNGKRLDLDAPLSLYLQKLYAHLEKVKISNDEEFTNFISHLYFLYRRIEIKMQRVGYENILPDFKSDEKSSIVISAQLLEAKNIFKSMDRSDFLKMYPVLKKLFFSYIDYINCSIKLESNINEGNHLPGTTDELKYLFNQLSTWFPMKINGEWRNCTVQIIGTPKGFEQVIRKLQETTMFKEVSLFDDEEAIEPYIGEEGNKIINFGFINMIGVEQSPIPHDSKLFESKCPEECTPNMRRWICTMCGDFVSQKDTTLFCSCGSREYDEMLLTCPHPTHRLKSTVWINHNEMKEMNSEELDQFIKEIKDQQHPDLDIPISFYTLKSNVYSQKIKINNDSRFTAFISHLYFLYREIEIKMERASHPNVLPDLNSEENAYVNICINLDEAKENYRSMERKHFLSMYPIIKKLFFSYIDYFTCSVNYGSDMDEGDHLPGDIDEIKTWLEKLNTWFPIKVNNEWIECIHSVIVIPPNYKETAQTLLRTTKYKTSQVINDDQAVEPYIGEEDNKRIIFGLVNMEGAEPIELPDNAGLLKSQCPEDCTQELRRWICTKCGDYIQSNPNSTGQQFLFCSCGSKKYRERLLTCPHPSHRP